MDRTYSRRIFAITIFWVICLRFIDPPVTYLMIKRGFERKGMGKEWKLEKDWLDYDDMSNNLKRAAIAGEDAHFMEHNGFDVQAIQKAMEKNQNGKKLRGKYNQPAGGQKCISMAGTFLGSKRF